METPSPVKRKATIDLTRSDSEDEAPKRRRRVIEIESDDDDDEAPSPTMPWETDEWQAHCAKKRESPVMGILKGLLADVGSRYGPSTDIHGSDEEMWRKIHDPVGHQRMWLTRILKDPPEGYIEQQVAEFARKLDGPCECLRAGPDECVSRRSHACSCRLGDPGKCKATSHHVCCCRHVESYERGNCKATTHDCLCPHLESYERSDCKATTHACLCLQLESYERSDCKATTHHCLCPRLESYERSECKARSHRCICHKLESYEMSECKACN